METRAVSGSTPLVLASDGYYDPVAGRPFVRERGLQNEYEFQLFFYDSMAGFGKGLANSAWQQVVALAPGAGEAVLTLNGISPNSAQGQRALEHLNNPFRYNNQTQAIFGQVGNGVGDISGIAMAGAGSVRSLRTSSVTTQLSPMRTGLGDKAFDTRRQAFNATKQRAGVPRSASPSRQWVVGDDVNRVRGKSYRHSEEAATHGRYYEYNTSSGDGVVIAEHTNDGFPHFHAGTSKDPYYPRNSDFMQERYKQIGGKHHYQYRRRNRR